MRIVLVYDRVVKWGGAERVLMALHELWPEAPLYTAVYRPHKAGWAKVFTVKDTFLSRAPWRWLPYELFPYLSAVAFESFDFSDYDVVLSVTSADAKAIVTSPKTLHICYCLTPTRYLWSGYHQYLEEPGFGRWNPLVRLGMKLLTPRMRQLDVLTSKRPDMYLAISATVAQRIATYYRRDSTLLYPPVSLPDLPAKKTAPHDYYLVVSRLVPYKKLDYVIRACTKTKRKLKIIGTGIDEQRLRRLAGPTVEFVGSDLTDEQLGCYYQECSALLFPGDEDFGLTAVEAQWYGRPVIAYNSGGVAETVIAGTTGEVYNLQTESALTAALERLEQTTYNGEACRQSARRFSKEIFQQKMNYIVTQSYTQWRKAQS